MRRGGHDEVSLDGPLERPGAVPRFMPPLGKRAANLIRDRERQPQPHEASARRNLAEFALDDRIEVLARKRPEDDDVVQPVEELGAKKATNFGEIMRAQVSATFGIAEPDLGSVRLGAEVRGHHDHRAAKVCGAAATVGQTALAEHREQRIEHHRVRLFDLIEQHHRERLAPHRAGEKALVAAVADQA